MKIVSLYTAASGTTNAAITYQWINRARLDTIFFSIYALAGAGALDVAHEFSLQSTNQIGTNDPVGVIATKVALLNSRSGLSAANILAACDDSLRRLQTD
jgi:hypothetical protein